MFKVGEKGRLGQNMKKEIFHLLVYHTIATKQDDDNNEEGEEG
jgi:hypothetical protein